MTPPVHHAPPPSPRSTPSRQAGPSRATSAGRVAGVLATVLVAGAAGAVTGFVHRVAVDVRGAQVPVGLLAGLAALAGLVLLARAVGRSRLAVVLVAAAYTAPVLVLSQRRPEGDLVVGEDAWGLSLIGGVALIATVGVMVPFTAYHGDRADSDEAPTPSPEVATKTP